MFVGRLIGKLKSQFIRNESASVTVEFVIWFPFLLMMMAMMIGLSVGLTRQSILVNEMTQYGRAAAIGRFETVADASANFANRVAEMSVAGVGTITEANGIVTVRAEIPLLDLVPIIAFPTFFSAFENQTYTMSVQYFKEEV